MVGRLLQLQLELVQEHEVEGADSSPVRWPSAQLLERDFLGLAVCSTPVPPAALPGLAQPVDLRSRR
jgi:hypothetical protein